MEPTQFPNVNPAPFRFAQAPASFPSVLGMRSFDPALPAVGGYSRQDLERMRFALMQSGDDPGMLARINQISPAFKLRARKNGRRLSSLRQPAYLHTVLGTVAANYRQNLAVG